MYTNNELYFPHYVIPSLKNLRGEAWYELVSRVAALPECHEETLAFMLMMSRLNGCVTCETDSYRAMRGCAACTIQTLRRFKGPDEALIAAFEDSLADIREFVAQGTSLSTVISVENAEQLG
ncbi:MAG: hypothetical protein AAF125_22075 [Chloroflexota bacterium]